MRPYKYDWLVYIVIIICFGGMALIVLHKGNAAYEKRTSASCEDFKDYSVKDVPARCLHFFKD